MGSNVGTAPPVRMKPPTALVLGGLVAVIEGGQPSQVGGQLGELRLHPIGKLDESAARGLVATAFQPHRDLAAVSPR